MLTAGEISSVIRAEVAKYVDQEFSDTSDFSSDLSLVSDDQTAIALAVERRLGVKLDRRAYRSVFSVLSFSEALCRQLGIV